MKKIKKLLILLVTIIVLSLNFQKNIFAESYGLQNTDVNTPAVGNIFIRVDGKYIYEQADKIINRINNIRLEACKEGVVNPNNGKKLTLKDYKPVKWLNSLERYARLRSAEASVNWSHTRPNYKNTFKTSMAKVKNGYHSGENLALGCDMMTSIDGYYAEKKAYIQGRSGLTGHYENIIDPENVLIGAAGFVKNNTMFTAIEFGTLFHHNTTNDNYKQDKYNGNVSQLIEVNPSYLVTGISISGSNNVYIGGTNKLNLTVKMKNATKEAAVYSGAVWKSSNASVATVDKNGVVSGLKAGTTTISASVGGYSHSYKVSVKQRDIRVLLVKINEITKAITKGSSYNLNAVVTPNNATNKNLSYTSSNTKVATVDKNGKVIGKSAGTTIITVVSKDGSNKKATCKITVKNPIRINKIVLNKNNLTIRKNKTYQLKTVIYPNNATNKNLTWTSSNDKIVKVDRNGKITTKGIGTAVVSVGSNDGSKKSARIIIKVIK